VGSNEALLQSIIQAAILQIQNYLSEMAPGISAPIIDAIHAQTVQVDFSTLTAAITSMDADLKTHVDNMSAALVAAVNAKIPIYGSLTPTKFTVSNLAAVTSTLIIPANANRKGFTVYNNSTNSLYLCIENPATASNLIDFCASNAGPTSLVKWMGPVVPTQAIYGIRNAGSGGITAWEFT
jgi:hypothetical protein